MNKKLLQKDKEEKAIKFYKNYIENQEKELDWMYKQDEEYYRDEIEQKELLIKGFRTILNLIQKQDKIINKMAEQFYNLYRNVEVVRDSFDMPFGKFLKSKEEVIEYFKKVVDEDVKEF